jgi:hypothetical protein
MKKLEAELNRIVLFVVLEARLVYTTQLSAGAQVPWVYLLLLLNTIIAYEYIEYTLLIYMYIYSLPSYYRATP